MNRKEFEERLLEECAEAVHKAYCNYHLENKGIEYWTKGDYSLLDEPTKRIDRETVKAVFGIVWQWIEQQIKEARIDELNKVTGHCNAVRGSLYLSDVIENRIKELNSVQPDTNT